MRLRACKTALICGALLLSGGVAQAQPAPVQVSLGQPLQQKSRVYGREQLEMLRADLARTAAAALARGGQGAPAQVRLVLEDVTPNRPTPAELGADANLSPNSLGLGGAWIDGEAVMPDGAVRPLSFSFYETSLRNEMGPAIWSDVDRAFQRFAGELERGRVPAQPPPVIPQRAAFDTWPRG